MNGVKSLETISQPMDETKQRIIEEAKRIVEDALHSAKGHFAAASRWTSLHFWVGLVSTVFAAVAGASAFTNTDEGSIIAGILAVVVSILTACLTFVKPNNRAAQHLASANAYLSLRNNTRIFAEITIATLDDPNASTTLKELSDRRNYLNESSPLIPRWAFVRGRKGIQEGEADYAIDAKK